MGRHRAIAAVALFGASLVAAIVSCVGDASPIVPITSGDAGASSDGGSTLGTAGNACYGNGTCNLGLTCAPPGVCILNDAGAPTDAGNTTDGSSTDAGVDATFVNAAACPTSNIPVDNSTLDNMVSSCTGAYFCVDLTGGGACCTPAQAAQDAAIYTACTADRGCGAQHCGFYAPLDAATSCAPSYALNTSNAEISCFGSAGEGLTLCSQTQACPSTLSCLPTTLTSASSTITVGVCF